MTERTVARWALACLTAMIVLPVLTVWWMTAVPGRSFSGPLPPLSAEQTAAAALLKSDVVGIATTPHNLAHPKQLEDAARYIAQRLAALGYPVRIQTFRVGGRAVRNFDVIIDPVRADAPTLIVGAHYDSFSTAPGANDNGTGVAAVLELARQLVPLRGKTAVRIRLAFFVNEEPPYFQTDAMGSLVYAKALKRTGERVVGMFSLETIGFYSDCPQSQHYPAPLDLLYPDKGNFLAFVGMPSSRSLVRKTIKAFRAAVPFPSEGGTAPTFVPGIDWSDHWSFERVGIPALMITDTAVFRYPHYHRTSDRPDKIDYGKLARVTSGLATVLRNWR